MLKQPFFKQALNTSKTSDPKNKPKNEPKNGPKDGAEANSIALGETTPAEKPKTFLQKKLSALTSLPKGKVAAVLGVLGASSGLAFTQVAPTDLQETVLPDRLVTEAPLRRANDPKAEPFVINTRGLFLTHQIFYRKVEALARISGGVVTPSAELLNPGTQGSRSAKSKTGTTTGTTEAKTSSETKPADGSKKGTSSESSTKATAAKQAEQVVAAAPPPPRIEEPVFTGTTIDSVLEMRVAVAKDVGAIAFATSGGGTVTDLEGNALMSLPAETAAYAEAGNGIVVDGETLPTAFWVYPEEGGYVAIGDSWYRGRMLVALRERGLIAVNYVLLGDYLYSVVGSEMSPDWAIESLKAQAVAARSYALTHNIHPASEEYFDLDNTQRFQAYKGIGREANTTQVAVQETAGEFISHDGGIVESLYAASQAIVDDAHKGSGMSQFGAKDLAEQGYDYASILGHYYPGTGLGRIETDAE